VNATSLRSLQVATWLSVLIAASGAAAISIACTSTPAATSPAGGEEEGIEIQFSKMYSAITDGKRTFKVPAVVTGVTSVTWSTSDSDMVDLEPGSDGKSVTIIPRKAGTVSIIAKKGSLKGTATLEIAQATEEEWGYGNDRYNNGVALVRPERPDGGSTGTRPERKPPDPSLACTNCHAKGKQDVEHTPMQTAGYTDDELVSIFTKGEKPEGAAQRVMMNKEAWSSMHKWTMEPEEVRGIVVYLRALEPKSQGDVDFGGRGPGGGGKPPQ
jgi:hypothetical protein